MENQTLHPLYRQNPASQAGQTVSHTQPVHSRTPDEVQALRAALAKAQAVALQWKTETHKMDEIARAALAKLAIQKEAKQNLKADYQAARNDVDTWRTRYKEIAAAHHEAIASDTYATHSAGKEVKDLQRKLEKARAKIDEYKELLLEAENDRPEIEHKLQVGGAAFRKLKTLEDSTEKLDTKIRQLQMENTELRQKGKALQMAECTVDKLQMQVKQLEQENKSLNASAVDKLKKQVKQLEDEKSALSQQLQSASEGNDRLKKTLESAKHEVVARVQEMEQVTSSSQEKLRAAAQDALAKTAKLQACTEMLLRAEQILKTCSQLHATKSESKVLTDALNETISNVAQFLQSLKA